MSRSAHATGPLPGIAQAARLGHIDALARRAQQHQGPARLLIEARLQQLRDALAAGSGAAGTPQAAQTQTIPQGHFGLAQLLAHINGAAAPMEGGEPGGATEAHIPAQHPSSTTPTGVKRPVTKPRAAAPELKAISQYRNTWSRLSAEQRLHQALAQVPSNAGPLNTQRLLHEALAAMRDASPHYLHRFMVQVETLLWLEQLGPGAPAVVDRKPAHAPKAKSAALRR